MKKFKPHPRTQQRASTKDLIELRKDSRDELDEVCVRDAHSVHFEKMDDSLVICIVNAGPFSVRVHIGFHKNKLTYFASVE